MSYIKRKIAKFDFIHTIVLTALVVGALLFGKYFLITDWHSVSYYVQIFFLAIGAVILTEVILYFAKQAKYYAKGKEGEDYVEKILKNISNIEYERNLKTKNGDLDFLVKKNGEYYGLEVKNWSGRITYRAEDDIIEKNGYPQNVIKQVKTASKKAQQKLAEKNPDIKFVKPVIVFCDHVACVDIPNSKIKSGNVDVYAIGSSQVRELLK